MKKVLIITYYWPPAGGPGVQRWLKFVKYLPDFKITPVVYAPKNTCYPIIDSSFENEVSKNLIVIKQPIFEPYKFAAFFSKKKTKRLSKGMISAKKQSFLEYVLLWIRGNFFIPDARKFWVKPSVRFLSKYYKKEGFDAIITSGPPHSLHLIGLRLKAKTGVKWIADFRDPWTTISYHDKLNLTKSAKKKHETLEKKVLNCANHILVTSNSIKKEFEPLTSTPISILTNGYDTHHFRKAALTEKFTLSHIGSLLTGRNPEILWKALSELITEHENFKNDVALQLAGAISPEVLADMYKYQLNDYTILMGYLSHNKAIAVQHASQVLLLIEVNSEETRSIIPGKLFEYMASERPILAIGPRHWEVETIVKATQTGSCFTYDEKDALKKKILDFYEAFKQGALKTHPIGLQHYSRKALTEKLAGIIINL